MARDPYEIKTPEELLLGHAPAVTPEEEAERQRDRDQDEELRRLYLQGLMEQPWFREWLMGQLEIMGTFDNPLAASPGGFPDPMATQFYLGRKSVGVALWQLFDDLFPHLTSLMRREAKAMRNPQAPRVTL